MVESITLSSAVRRNLLTMQSTADMMSKTQTRLATGKKVNSALDNPTNFFTASALNARSSDLMRLQDSVNNAVQTIEAADNGLKAITKLVESAQGLTRQALQAPKQTVTTVASASGDDILPAGLGTSSTDIGAAGAAVLNFERDGTDYTVTLDGTESMDDINTKINAATPADISGSVVGDSGSPEKFSLDIGNLGNEITITSVSGASLADLGLPSTLAASNTTSTTPIDTKPTSTSATDITSLSGSQTLTFDVDGTVQTINLMGAESLDQIAASISSLDGLTGSVEAGASEGEFKLVVTADENVSTFTGGGTAAATLGLTGVEDVAQVVSANAMRTSLQTEYNDLLKQIDGLINDAGFNGNNLLAGDSLKVIFNESGTSSLTLGPQDTSSLGLGLTAEASGNFQDNVKVQTTLDNLDKAVANLRSSASSLGSNLSTVEARKDFTKNMINTLETGAANLTLADINKEGANMLALQTRQQLTTSALSMASQEDQAVLRLF